MHWDQNCHHQPWCPSSSEPRMGRCRRHQILAGPLLPQLEGLPGLGLQNAPMMNLAPRIPLPAWAPSR